MCFEKFKRPWPARGLFDSGRADFRVAREKPDPNSARAASGQPGPSFEKSPRADPRRPETNTNLEYFYIHFYGIFNFFENEMKTKSKKATSSILFSMENNISN
jgi:hypothetical protein